MKLFATVSRIRGSRRNRFTNTPCVVSAEAAAPLRVWPVMVSVALVVVTRAAFHLMRDPTPSAFRFTLGVPAFAGVGLLLYWIVAGRASAVERWVGPLSVALIAAVCYWLLHPSNQGKAAMFYFVPSGVTCVGMALVALYRCRPQIRLWGAVLAAVIGFASWEFVRNDGIWGNSKATRIWRWSPTAEARFIADLKQRVASRSEYAADEAAEIGIVESAAWPEFRGPNRDGSVPGIVLETDWQLHPPKEIWRRKVGPGWSSFAVAGRSIFTQEQRGAVEVVVCYEADTGAERWTHQSPARFFEAAAGVGPRATPTLAGGRLFVVGATGLVHCLNPANGDVAWQRDLTKDAERETLMWGYSSSPLIVDDLVIVYAGGTGDRGVFAYNILSGEPRWSAAAGNHSYSSPQRATVGGEDYVLILTNTGLSAIAPADGTIAWNYEWFHEGYRALQPLVLESSSVVLGTGTGTGTRRIDITLADSAPDFKERWTSLDIKPNFNDYVAHRGCLYGFDQNIFACINLETGKRHWKKGRYGNGQVLLLPDADQLLVLAETGEVVLLRANPDCLEEMASVKVLADKTWNHPVLVGDRLYVRNGEEAVCLELPRIDAASVGTIHAGR